MKRAVLAILLVAAGCERHQPAVQEPARFGVSWEVIGDDAGSNVALGTGGDGGSIQAGSHKLEIKDKRAILNGKDYGALNNGDQIKVERDGRVLVNGKERSVSE